jgi:hypothetical protein
MTSTPPPWIAEPIVADESYETLKEERDDWVAIIGNVQIKAGRFEDEIWRGRDFVNVALCRRENASLLLTAPKLLAACKQLLSIHHGAAHADANALAACAPPKRQLRKRKAAPSPTQPSFVQRDTKSDPILSDREVVMAEPFRFERTSQAFVRFGNEAWRSAGEDYVRGI